MKRTFLIIGIFLLEVFFVVPQNASAASISPTTGSPGDTLTINYDTNDCLQYGSSSVTIGGEIATVQNWYSCLGIIYVTVPNSTSGGDVFVNTKSGAQEYVGYFSIDFPWIDSISPTIVEPGVTVVTITGRGFKDDWYVGNDIFFAGIEAETIYVWNETEIQALVPASVQSGGKVSIKIEPFDTHYGPSFTLVTGPSNDTYSYRQKDYLNLMKIPDAWNIKRDSKSVIVAVIDDGIDMVNTDLRGNPWVNIDEFPNDGIDNDNNGYIDDKYGYDFSYSTYGPIRVADYLPGHIAGLNDPYYINHGTMVAGTMAAVGNNQYGIAGVTWNVKIMNLLLFELWEAHEGQVTSEQLDVKVAEAITYAVDNGADIINMSFGIYRYSALVDSAVQYAHENGVILIAAVGNDNYNLNAYPAYPACYNNVIGVAATDLNDKKASFSNYGSCVDISAVGTDIIVLDYDITAKQTRAVLSGGGTSFSAPFVSGVAALLKAKYPTWTSYQIKQAILDSTDDINSLNWSYYGKLGSGRLNAYKALTSSAPQNVDSIAPTGPTGVTTYSDSGKSVILDYGVTQIDNTPYFEWEGASDDLGGSGIAGYYVYLGKDINADPVTSGTYVTFRGYSGSTTENGDYYLIIKTKDRSGNVSESLYITYKYQGAGQQQTNTSNISDGALIRAIGGIDVYIVKYVGSKKFKRLVLSPTVFNSYGHLRWEDIMDVDNSVIDSFITSELVRATVAGDPRVYKLYPSGDTGEKRWIRTAYVFNNMGYDWDAIYTINETDRDSYLDGADMN